MKFVHTAELWGLLVQKNVISERFDRAPEKNSVMKKERQQNNRQKRAWKIKYKENKKK